MTIDRRELIHLAALAGLGATAGTVRAAAAAGPSPAAVHEAPTAPAAAPHGFVIDGCGSPGEATAAENAPLSPRAVDDARHAGVTAINVTIGPVGTQPSLVAFEGIVRDLARWEGEIAAHPEALTRISAAADLDRADTARRLGLIYGLQDGVAFADDLSRLDVLYRLGLRIVQPTYNGRNLLGDGCLEPDGAGLSRAGHDAVLRLNELGILIDLSHCGRRTTREALAASTRPVAFTHTGCAALTDHPRNKSDEELRALADRGGVAGIYFMPYLRAAGQPMAADVVRHVEHAWQVAGEDHVGIGTDGSLSAIELTEEYRRAHAAEVEARRRAGIGAPGENADVYTFVPDLNSPQRLARLGELLAARGHGAGRIEKLLGGNFARLFAAVWR